MAGRRLAAVLLPVAVVLMIAWYLLWPRTDTAQLWEARKAGFEAAARRAEPLLTAIRAYSDDKGEPPQALDELLPQYLREIPETGLQRCRRFEYRLLPDKQAFLVWYDLGSRQGRAIAGRSRYRDGDPDHAILVFTLDGGETITSALIDRAPKDIEPVDFHATRWKAGQGRMQMAPALAETYRLYRMPRAVFEDLLGPADGSRALDRVPWELRISCPTGLFSPNALIYWPGGQYPAHLYGGATEPVGSWVYIRD